MAHDNIYLASKPRYEILDGLRGVASILVMFFHFSMAYNFSRTETPLGHISMAVDFFFLLSGYVIGYAYDDRWGSMGVWGFCKRRLVRLHPMIVMGTLVGTVLFYFTGSFEPGDHSSHLVDQTPVGMLLLITLLGMLLIPTPKSLDIRGWAETNNLNPAHWSLFFEYIANILYALFIRRFSKKALAVLVLAAAFLTLDKTLHLDVFGMYADMGGGRNSIGGGFYLTGQHLFIGFVRLLYPFFCGLLLSRLGARIPVRGGFWWCTLMLTALLLMPFIPGGEIGTPGCLDGIYYAVSILVLFPLLVCMGAGSRVTGRSSRVCRFLGDISYPLYVTHNPIAFLQRKWVVEHPDAPLSQHVFIFVILCLTAIALAWAMLRLYDEPVRKWLREKLWKKAAAR